MLSVAEAASDAAVELDEAVDRFGAAVAGAAGVEVGQERLAPLLERLAEPPDLRGSAGRELGEDLVVALVGDDRSLESCALVGR